MFTTNDQKLCIIYRQLFGFVDSIIKYEQNSKESYYFINFLNDHEPNFNCFTRKRNLCSNICAAPMQLTKFQKLRIFHTKGKNNNVADMLSRSFTQKELQRTKKKQKVTCSISICSTES